MGRGFLSRGRSRLLLVALSLALAATTAACSSSDDDSDSSGSSAPGVTSDEIKFALLSTGSANPMANCYLDCYKGGVQAYFDYKNSKGGVLGRKLTISETVDDEYTNTKTKLLELSESEDIFGIMAAPVNPQGYEEVAKARVPLYIEPSGTVAAAGHDSIFVSGILCADCKRKDVVAGAKAAGKSKIGILGLSGSQVAKVCTATIKDAIDTFGPDAGVKAVYVDDTVPPGVPNGLAAQVTAMKEAGVDYINTCFDQNTELKLEQELERQGMGDTPVVLLSGYGDSKYLETNAKLLEGNIMALNFRPLEASTEGTVIPELKTWFEKGGYQLNDVALMGWINADMAATGIEKAGEGFDREKVIKATNEITYYTAGGLLSGVNFTKWHGNYTSKNIGTEGQKYDCQGTVRITNGKTELVGDPSKPFSCYDRSSPVWEESLVVNTLQQ